MVSQHNFKLIFSSESLKADFPARLSRLLDLPVCKSDGLSEYVCRPCTRKVDALTAFRLLAKESYQCQGSKEQVPCRIPSSPVSSTGRRAPTPRKRTKDTSGTEASPHTVQSRPLTKRITVGTASKRLAFSPIQTSRHFLLTSVSTINQTKMPQQIKVPVLKLQLPGTLLWK